MTATMSRSTIFRRVITSNTKHFNFESNKNVMNEMMNYRTHALH